MTARRRSRAGYSFCAGDDVDAGDEPFQVPFPRADRGLVEVVQVKDHFLLRRAVQPEVTQVGVAGQNDRQARRGRVGQIPGHDGGRAAQETERRGRHAPHAQRQQFALAALVGRQQSAHGIGPVCRGLPLRVGLARHAAAYGLARRPPLLPGSQPLPPDRRGLALATIPGSCRSPRPRWPPPGRPGLEKDGAAWPCLPRGASSRMTSAWRTPQCLGWVDAASVETCPNTLFVRTYHALQAQDEVGP